MKNQKQKQPCTMLKLQLNKSTEKLRNGIFLRCIMTDEEFTNIKYECIGNIHTTAYY